MTEAERHRIHEAMVRLADGDRGAFATVFEGLWPDLRRFTSRALLAHPDAEDVAQQALLKVFARISDFDTARDGVAWAFGIAAFEVRTLRRKLARRREMAADLALGEMATGQTPEEVVIDRDVRMALLEVLGELSEADRQALLGNSASGVSPAAWRKRRQRALERLRGLWRRRHA